MTTYSYYEMEDSLRKVFSEEDLKEFIEEVLKMESDNEILNFWNDERLNEAIEKEEREIAKREGLEQGLTQGLEQGKAKERNSLIESMFKNELDINLISKITGTSIKQLQKIKTNLFL